MAEDALAADSAETIIPIDGDSPSPQGSSVASEPGSSAKVETQPSADEKRVSDTQTALKETQKEFHQTKEQLAEIRGELAVLKQQREQLSTPLETPREDWLTGDDFDETEMKMVKNLRGDMASVLDERDQTLLKRMGQMLSVATNPERVQLQDTIGQLSQHPWFQQLDDSSKLSAARSYHDAIPEAQRKEVKAPSGSPAGDGKRVVSKQNVREAAIKLAQDKAKAIWGDPDAKHDDTILTVREEARR